MGLVHLFCYFVLKCLTNLKYSQTFLIFLSEFYVISVDLNFFSKFVSVALNCCFTLKVTNFQRMMSCSDSLWL